MQVQIIESNRGGKIALHDGHSYNQKKSTINCIQWRCTKYYKLKCPAILKTKNETFTETKGTHNHECDPGECKAKEVVNQIKRRAHYSTPTVAIANDIYEISEDYAVQLGCSYGTWKKIRKCRSLNMFQETAGLLCSKRPRYEKIKKHMQNIRSTYEFENAVPYISSSKI